MANFAYAGRTRGGEIVNGERIAESMDAAVAALRRERILVTKISPAKSKADDAKKGGGKAVGSKNLAVFTRQFSVMIDAGLPLVQCLDILGNQEEDKNFAEIIHQTRTLVESGASLADAMRKHPKAFDPLFTNMVAAGEAGGILDTILKRLATYIEKAVKLKGQVKCGDDLSDRRDDDREPRRRGDSVESHPDLRGDVRQPRCRLAAADPRRHLDEPFARHVLPDLVRIADCDLAGASGPITRPTAAGT